MATFPIKSDLTIAEQNKMDALLAITAAQRTTSQAAWLAARLPYQTNVVIKVGADGNILAASGLTLPTGLEGFSKGATFTKTDATGNGLYMNTGDETSATWDLIDEAATANIPDKAVTMAKLADIATQTFIGRVAAATGVPKALTVAEVKTAIGLALAETPVNGVAASKVLTVGTNPVNEATVSLGGVTYRFMSVLGAGVAATGTLTFNSELPHDGDTVILGSQTYTFKTALSTEPTVPNEILIEATVTATIDNLIAAVDDGAGEGTKYSTGTVSQGMVTCTKPSADTFLVTYDTVGFLGNQYDTAGTLTHATWGAATLAGGIDAQAANDVLIGADAQASIDNLVLAITAGVDTTKYGTGTVVNPLATAVKASAATMTATNLIKGEIGNSTAVAETLADGSWAAGATALSGGVNGTVGNQWDIAVDTSYIYVAIAANTTADANWRRVALGSAY